MARLVGIAVVTCAGAVSAQVLAASRASDARRLTPNWAITSGTLANGLVYSIRRNRRPEDHAELRPAGSIERVRDDLIERLYARVLDRRLEEVALRGDAPFLRAKTGFRDLPGGLGAASVEVIASDGRLDAALAGALTEVERLAQHGATATELERQKRVLRRCLEAALAARDAVSSDRYADAYVRHFLAGSAPASIEDEVARARAVWAAIGPDDVAAAARR